LDHFCDGRSNSQDASLEFGLQSKMLGRHPMPVTVSHSRIRENLVLWNARLKSHDFSYRFAHAKKLGLGGRV